jgi:hypothetical protein
MEIKLPDEDHDAIVGGEWAPFFNHVATSAQMNEQIATTHFGADRGKTIEEVAPILAYVNVSRAAWQLISCADVADADFDPVAFGKRCEAIAREQAERYRVAVAQAMETKGNA